MAGGAEPPVRRVTWTCTSRGKKTIKINVEPHGLYLLIRPFIHKRLHEHLLCKTVPVSSRPVTGHTPATLLAAAGVVAAPPCSRCRVESTSHFRKSLSTVCRLSSAVQKACFARLPRRILSALRLSGVLARGGNKKFKKKKKGKRATTTSSYSSSAPWTAFFSPPGTRASVTTFFPDPECFPPVMRGARRLAPLQGSRSRGDEPAD